MSNAQRTTAGLAVSELSVAIAHVSQRGRADATDGARQTLGVPLPDGARLTQAGTLRILGISPGRWLALREPADHDFVADFASLLKPYTAVCDLSDAYVVLRLRGHAVRPTLARLIAIDLHARAFEVGQVAATVAAHIPVTLWRLPDAESVTFELAVPRSFAATWHEVLAEAAASSSQDTER